MNRLTTRLVLSHLFVIVVAMSLLGLLLLSLVQRYFEQSLHDSLLVQARLVSHGLMASPPLSPTNIGQAILPSASNAVQQQSQNQALTVPDITSPTAFGLDNATLQITTQLNTRIRLVSAIGVVLADSASIDVGKNLRGDPLIAGALAGQEGARTEAGQGLVAVPFRDDRGTSGVVYLSQPLTDMAVVLADLRVRLALSAGIALVLSGLIGFVLARAIARPVRELTTAADRLAQSDFDYPLSTTSTAELAHMARSFRLMRDQLRHTLQVRTDLVVNVSHELRTPLTAIKGLTETLQDGAMDDPAARDRFLESIESQTDRLIRLVNDLLLLSRADAQSLGFRTERVDLTKLARTSADELGVRAAERSVTIDVNGDSALVNGDSDRLKQVFVNLIDNALRYSPPRETISVTVKRDATGVVATIRDCGPGVPPADLPYIFDRFYRGDRSRQRTDEGTGGAGLGLAIAKALVEAHGGSISLENGSGQTGAIVRFRLPAA